MSTNTWDIKMLFDGGCPACKAEMRILKKWDKGRGRIEFEDIAAPDWNPDQYGITFDEAMGAMHAILPDGSIVTGVEAFRRGYAAVGRRWLLAWTTLPVCRQIADWAYRVFARNRYRITKTECTDRCKPRV